jgi:hypothetical protein
MPACVCVYMCLPCLLRKGDWGSWLSVCCRSHPLVSHTYIPNTMKCLLALIAIVAFTYHAGIILNSPDSYETRQYTIERGEQVILMSQDGTQLTDQEVAWANNASATNIGTSVDIMHNSKATTLTVVQAYNALGMKILNGSTSTLY